MNLQRTRFNTRVLAAAVALVVAGPLIADEPARNVASGQDPGTLVAAQRAAMEPLHFMDGVWRGPASTILADGSTHKIIQTERIGPFLQGSLKVIEGRGYEADGRVAFNAFGVVSYDPLRKLYAFHSYAMGRAGDFSFKPLADGYVWEIPAGPVTIRYTATIHDGAWREIGERIAPGAPPQQFFEMNLRRVGDTSWPEAGAITPR